MSGHGDNSGTGGTGVAGRGGKRRRKGGRGRGKDNLAATSGIDQVNPDPQTTAPTESSSPVSPTPISNINLSPVVELVTNLTTPPAQMSTSSSLPVAAKPALPTGPVGASTVPVTGVDESQEGTTEAIIGESPSTPKPSAKKKNTRKGKGKGKGKGKAAVVNEGETTENIQVDASVSACGNEAVSSATPGPATSMSNTSPGPVSGSSSTPAPVPTKPGASGSTPSKSKAKPKSIQPPEPQSQYHHYIPRLVLREFASAEDRAAEPRNPFVHVYSMENATITPTRVARCYGYVDMYQDISAKDAMHIEKSLAKLEREASGIVSRIKKAVEQGETSIKLTRVERNQVRKFLFVMKYRTPLFWAKYNRSVEEYQHIDREAVLEFMREKNFARPVEVWLHTLKTILDTPIDPDENWEDTLTTNCFIHDALWYLMNMNESFMAFCTPQDPATDEFVVSESAFGIHEGPTDDHGSLTEATEKKPPPKRNNKADLSSEIRALDQGYGWYTEYHKMAPFSPKLLLVLRSNFLRDEDSKKTLRKMAEIGSPGSHQWKKPSLFDHLHLDPPQPSYVNNPTIGSDGIPTAVKYSNQDEFTFTLHKLSHKDVVLFNSIIFSNVRRNLTWHSDQAMKVALEEYLKEEKFLLPAELAFFSGKEDIEKMWEVERRQQLQRLLAILKGHQGAQGIQIPTPPVSSHVKGLSEFEERFSKNPLSEGYFKMGGTAMNWMRDFFQASQVTKMRNMVSDALPQGPHRLAYRNGVSRANMAFFATLSPIVIYLHISTWMVLQANRQAGPGANLKAIAANYIVHNEDENPHDAVAKVSKKLPWEHLSKLMLQSSLRRVSQREDILRNRDITEYSCFSTFGGLTSSFLIESTPWYDPSIDTFLLNPYRSIEVPKEMFLRDMMVRFQVKRAGIIRAKWGAEVDEFVWKWLYEGPEDD